MASGGWEQVKTYPHASIEEVLERYVRTIESLVDSAAAAENMCEEELADRLIDAAETMMGIFEVDLAKLDALAHPDADDTH